MQLIQPITKAIGNTGMRIATVVMLRQRELDNWRGKGYIEYLMLKLHINQLGS